MLIKTKKTYVVFVTDELLNDPINIPVGIYIHLIIIPNELKDRYENSKLQSLLNASLISSNAEEIILYNTSNKIGDYYFEQQN